MAEIVLKSIKTATDDRYLGFKLPGLRVVPVHIYSGASRLICGYVSNVENIQKLSYVCDAHGKTPEGRDTGSILKWLQDKGKIDAHIEEQDLNVYRLFLQQILNSDGAVFSGTNTNMVSYTSGSDSFVCGKSMYEDAGELIAELIKLYCPDLTTFIKQVLQDRKDVISLLFLPVLDSDSKTPYQDPSLPLCFEKIDEYPNAKLFLDELKESGCCLLEHLRLQENKLNVLRMFNLFCMFHLFRFMANVEHIYRDSPKRLFLLDFSDGGTNSQSRMSSMTYMQVHRSFSSFYKWGYSEILKLQGWNKDSLMIEDTPSIDNTPVKEELKTVWNLAKKQCESLGEDEAMSEFAATVFNMLERDKKVSPTTYIKLFGIHAGILVQGTRSLPPRFKPKSDMLEMIIRCCVKPGETIRGIRFKELLWKRMNIIIGGDEKDIERLNDSGCRVTTDEDSLITNYEQFAEKLRVMNFAETMADGILQIHLGDSYNG